MEYKIQYTTVDDRTRIITENPNLVLIGEQNLLEGNFLIFSGDTPQEIVTTVKEQEQRISDLEMAMAAVLGGAV